MMIEEFIKIAKITSISHEDYKIVEFAYMYHPAVGTKEDAAKLYNGFGITIFKDMAPRCELIAAKEQEIQTCRLALEALKEDLEELKK